MLRVIFLDAEGTFLKFKPSLSEIYRRLWGSFGIKINSEKISEKLRFYFKKVFKEELKTPLNGEICKEGWREVFHRAFEEYKNDKIFNEVFKAAYAFFASPECVTVVPGFMEFLLKGKKAGLSFAVISNWDCRLYPILEGHNLLSYFEGVFLGCEVGYLKPSPEIFKRALSYFQISPEEALMIGDTLEDDIEPSQKLGLHTYHIQGEPDYLNIWNHIQRILSDQG